MDETSVEEEFKETLEKIKQTSHIAKAQYIAEMVTHHCVSTVAVLIVHNLVPKDTLSRNKRAQLYIATWAMSGQIADTASEWAANNIGNKLKFVERLVKAVRYGSEKPQESTETTPVTEGPRTEE